MKRIKYIALIVALLLGPVMLIRAASPQVLTVAVFDFDSKSDAAVRDLGPQVAAMVSAALSTDPNIITVERAELAKSLGEQELGLSGTVSPDTAAKVGQLTGAKVLVTGRVFKIDKETVMVAKIIGTETSRVYGEMVKGSGTATPSTMAEELAKKISRVVTEKGDTLVAKVASRDERMEKLLSKIKAGKRPAVSLDLPEQHFGARVRDPAAATELGLYLQKAGFEVVDEKSDKKPDIEITGEAFSAFAMRKGNLVSCRSRIELKARERTTGKILLVDRQTSVAVDVSEQTAAKTALENAADDLAERVLPALAK
jgi:hypothetical protein